MAKKKLKIDFIVNMEDNSVFNDIEKINVETGVFYEETRKYLNKITGLSDLEVLGFEDMTLASFKSVDQDLDAVE